MSKAALVPYSKVESNSGKGMVVVTLMSRNPAAEMQAIDRTHRIGQHKPIFATRLIVEDTIEVKARTSLNTRT
jgi:hypothetical protein